MSTSGLATPPRAASRTPPPAPEHDRAPRIRFRMYISSRRPLDRHTGRAFLFSVGVHLLVLLLAVIFIRDVSPVRVLPPTMEALPEQRVEIVELFPLRIGTAVAVSPPEVPAADEIQERFPEAVTRPPVTPPVVRQPAIPAGGGASGGAAGPEGAGGVAPGAGAPGGAGGAGDALRPGYRDSRFYVMPSPYVPDLRTDHEKYMEHFSARIDAVNDSLGIATNRNRTTSDWTYTDKDGKKWGLSPDGVHLGDLTIPRALLPLPGPTGDNASREAARE
ncbi:MAG: hypothetical protein LBG44_09995, partial [Gemmatimonadota bacterium]|nr:hypothetical protein [Gemmatimonadota bacterium]